MTNKTDTNDADAHVAAQWGASGQRGLQYVLGTAAQMIEDERYKESIRQARRAKGSTAYDPAQMMEKIRGNLNAKYGAPPPTPPGVPPRPPGMSFAGAAIDAATTVGDTRNLIRAGTLGSTIYNHLRTPTFYRKALGNPFAGVGPAAVAGGALETVPRVFGTPTSDYETRFGFGPATGSPLRQAVRDVGVRTLGAASDIGPSIVSAVSPFIDAPEDYTREALFRDVQQKKQQGPLR